MTNKELAARIMRVPSYTREDLHRDFNPYDVREVILINAVWRDRIVEALKAQADYSVV